MTMDDVNDTVKPPPPPPQHENQAVVEITNDDNDSIHEDEGADTPEIENLTEQGVDGPIVPDAIDGDNEVVGEVDVDTDAQEQVMEDACHDMVEEQSPRQQDMELRPDVAAASDVMGTSTRSGRRAHKYNYVSLGSRGTTQFFK